MLLLNGSFSKGAVAEMMRHKRGESLGAGESRQLLQEFLWGATFDCICFGFSRL